LLRFTASTCAADQLSAQAVLRWTSDQCSVPWFRRHTRRSVPSFNPDQAKTGLGG